MDAFHQDLVLFTAITHLYDRRNRSIGKTLCTIEFIAKRTLEERRGGDDVKNILKKFEQFAVDLASRLDDPTATRFFTDLESLARDEEFNAAIDHHLRTFPAHFTSTDDMWKAFKQSVRSKKTTRAQVEMWYSLEPVFRLILDGYENHFYSQIYSDETEIDFDREIPDSLITTLQ